MRTHGEKNFTVPTTDQDLEGFDTWWRTRTAYKSRVAAVRALMSLATARNFDDLVEPVPEVQK